MHIRNWTLLLLLFGMGATTLTLVYRDLNSLRPIEPPSDASSSAKDKDSKTYTKKDEDGKEVVCRDVEELVASVDRPKTELTPDLQEVIGYQNNKVGLYIYAEVDEYVEKAAEMTNANGGDWGYVLLPFNVKETNDGRWVRTFQALSEKHLIPIVQLWDLDVDDKDKMEEQIKRSAVFLNRLPWPIENRYVSAYNETNDAKFWKGKVDPEQYARVLDMTITELKKLNKNFFVMNGAFNASARSGGDYLSEDAYMLRMDKEVPGIFRKLNGWASHPYPQPNFAGSPKAGGRDSVRTYEWELLLLEQYFGINKKSMPVFITETGWAHRETKDDPEGNNSKQFLTKYQAADNMRYAFENVWMKDDRVVAVTPFTIRYDAPFDHFSWLTSDNKNYPQFDSIKDMKKVKGKPPVMTYATRKVVNCE